MERSRSAVNSRQEAAWPLSWPLIFVFCDRGSKPLSDRLVKGFEELSEENIEYMQPFLFYWKSASLFALPQYSLCAEVYAFGVAD